ncbi:hypothetical protein NLY43_05600 [Mesorhizobium sp. C416B]|uniref:hypothetical protein n=1 Tax=unclassified Mesorhizobium TaxID=325217 RepID=UPI0003CE191B|nr:MULTISPECIES: hypothetical protein [unclassified Mesorhizobium]ESX45117.1 hypothetical protein X762_27145 [Mesorhizobium sp. LSHC426A00]ESX51477.1 hypothetical protein X761_24900 [Mesorhizobium sp. LSHC424B00]ESX66440.1 hypothetical protein X758_26210 [Mesorhizobium sp. LSHC416B00]WJI64237.1 hypothetical protein NLY43_05600 [Mesorhizobium sp. C416B]
MPDADAEAGYDFIELGRTFNAFSDYVAESDDLDVSSVFHVARELTWTDLLREYRVVLLSEAGSGKTAEIRSAAKKIRTSGKPGFFLRLEHVVTNFEDAFEVGTYAEFETWRGSNTEGWLFLDSVDEARLRSPNDFDLAIRKLGRVLDAAKARTHVLITGRIAAWRPKTDLAICSTHLSYTPPTTSEVSVQSEEESFLGASDAATAASTKTQKKPPPVFKAFALADLSSGQIEAFAQARGIADSKAFLDAVARADAWSFTARPQDLEELTGFWIENQRIGSRLEVIRSSIDRRLVERDPNRAEQRPMTLNRALEGARLLAVAATLLQNQVIRVPDAVPSAAGIPIQSVLPGWDEKEHTILLSRPIFDEAIYGTVRFHHRSVREYLTAEWFAGLLGRETSRRNIEGLFFRSQYGLDIVVPALRPILPWLTLLDERIRARVRKVAPEIIFEGGDPSHLPLELRRYILQEVCEQMAAGDIGRSIRDYSAVERFANVDLTQEVRDLLGKYADNADLTAFLLRMVWLGQLKEALPEVLQIALTPGGDHYVRTNAFRALRASGSDDDRRQVRDSFLAEGAVLNREWFAELLEGVEPTAEATSWLIAALGKVETKERYSVDHLTERVTEFVTDASIPQLSRLISALNELLGRAPFVERRHCEISEVHKWLMVPAAKGAERLIENRDSAALADDTLDLLHKIATARGYGFDDIREIKEDFAQLVSGWPELNRALFWREVLGHRERLQAGETLTDHWRVSIFGTFTSFGDADFGYVVEQINKRALVDDRLLVLSLAFSIYVKAGRPAAWRAALKGAAAADAVLTAKLRTYLKPPAQKAETRRWKRTNGHWKKRDAKQKLKNDTYHADWKSHLVGKLAEEQTAVDTKPGQLTNALLYLLDQTRKNEARSGRWTNYNWKDLILNYGQEVAQFFRDGTVNFWRHYVPKIRSEGAPDNSTPHAVIIGLTGLEIEATEMEGWATHLSNTEVENACRYASFELNGFPVWFPHLFQAHPETVSNFLLQEIRFDLSRDEEVTDTNYILSDLGWSGSWAWDALAPKLSMMLSKSEPKNLSNLDRLLKILQGSNLDGEYLAALAKRKCSSLRNPKHLARWFAVWTGVAPAHAIAALTAHFAKMKLKKKRTDFAMLYASHLWGGRRTDGTGVRQAFKTPAYLKTLYLLLHEHIRRKEDIERAGKDVYSPGLRDDAQDSRNGIFEALNKIPGKEAYLALLELSQAHPEESSRPWMAHLAKVKAEQDGDMLPWTAQQVRDFGDKLERTPRNHRELAELAILRLLDLKDDLENGDSSVASILRPVSLETDMRKFLGNDLRSKALSRYTVTQEEQLADDKRMDIRFHGIGFDGPVPGELKLADKWTGPELLERLENQLCGDYLRDNLSNRGLFVLIYRGHRQGWDIPGTGNRVDFDGLVKALAQRWVEISASFPNVEDVTVIGIDLTARNK